jgi:hypothetical protein
MKNYISNDDGFSLTFHNDIRVSVQFGSGTYSDKGETTAEVAVIDKYGNWYAFDNGELVVYPEDQVNPRVTTDELADILHLAKEL